MENLVNESDLFKEFGEKVKENLESLEKIKKELDIYINHVSNFYEIIQTDSNLTKDKIIELAKQADVLENNFLDTINF